MGNAVKFTEKGEVKILISSRKLAGNSVELYFKIIDTGIGISPGQLQNIFESFSQASSDTTRKYGGSGLGLAISKKLLEIMGSRIQVKSKQGVGSEFSFKLIFEKGRAQNNDNSAQEQKPEPEVRNLKGLKILLVEDNKINTRIAKQILEKWDIEVEWAEDGQVAINKFKPGKFDLILMDLHMPNVDGFDASRAIRKLDKKIPIVALTAAIKIQDKDKVLEAGMNEFVSKPFKPKELFNLIGKLTFNESDEEKNKKLKSSSGYESLKGYKILLVEDNDINIKIASQFLQKWDIEVEVAKDGQIAIDMFEVDKYHLILMDLHLPNVDGYQATKEIRQIDKNIPIIALTAAAQVQDKEKVLTEGMNDFISKPFKPKDLYNKITNGLMNATLNDE
jgi:CheY-like chemotaxis protein